MWLAWSPGCQIGPVCPAWPPALIASPAEAMSTVITLYGLLSASVA
jgi:hypothetical protein